MSPTLTPVDSAAYTDHWKAAREAKEQQRRNPGGFLSYAGFHKLATDAMSFGSIPGRWSTGPGGPRVQLAEGEQLLVDGQVVTGSHQFAPVAERELRRAAHVGEVILELSKRGGQDLLRPIDPAFGRQRIDVYEHTPAYHLDPRWIVDGQFAPFDSVRPTPVNATIGGIVHTHLAVGEVAFPAEAGPLTLDFNYTQNLQRPYTAFAPCPLPPAQKSVTAAIEAGEQLPVFTR
jgi:hypothetical protein